MPEPQNAIPEVRDKRPRLTGLLPKNAQTKVIAGVALLMILVMMFSGRKHAPTKAAQTSGGGSQAVIDPSVSRIQDYRARIEEQTRKLAQEEAELAHAKERALATAPSPGSMPPLPSQPSVAAASTYAPGYPESPEKNWIETDREKREYEARFASNIALSHRKATPEAPPAQEVDHAEPPPASKAPTGATKDGAVRSPVTGAKEHRLFEGTILETVLTNRLDSSFSGPVNCMVTTDVYARDHQTLLIPQGARVLGEAKKTETFGEQRLAVAFHRLIMPDGYSVSLDQFKGLDQVGQTGLLDQVNHHYLQIFGVSLAIGAIAGLSQATTQYGVNETGAQAYEQGTASSLSQSSLHILDRYLNVLPTFTIREGHRIKIYLSQDLLLPAYNEHPVNEP